MKVTVFQDCEIARSYNCDDYEEIEEGGCSVLYVINNGFRKKVCILGFWCGFWSYEVER